MSAAEAERERFARAVDAARTLPKDTLLVVVGPTASGKSELAMQMCEALDGEIVSADSVQIFRHFDAGSGKPSADDLRRAPHHLVDALDPLDPIDAARFAEMADDAIADVTARGRRPVVCGGTFLWTKALLFGLADAAPADAARRAAHRELAQREGEAALHARLAAVDPDLAARLHPRDVLRVSRGLEVFELTGRPLSAWQAEHGFAKSRRAAELFAVERSAEELTTRITARVEGFLRAGWVDEVRSLVARGYGDARAMGSVGYRQIAEHLAGSIPAQDLAPAIVRATRVFARRQRTWLRGLGRGGTGPVVRWI